MEAALGTRVILRQTNLVALTESTEKLIKDSVAVDLQELTRIKTSLKNSIRAFEEEVFKYIEKCPNQTTIDTTALMNVQLKAEDLLASLEASYIIANSEVKTSNGSNNNTSRLPKLDLARYDGNILKWTSFWDRFNASVHSKTIPDVEKLSYLLCTLEGSARQAVEGLETTSANYAVARDILEGRFGKRDRVIDAHNEALQNLPKAQATGTDCRRTLNDIEKHLRLLEAMGEQTDASYLRVVVMSKFPEKVVYQVDLMTAKDQSITAIRGALNEVISALEKSEGMLDRKTEITPSNSNTTPASTSTLHTASKRRWDQSKGHKLRNKGSQKAQHKRPKLRCVFCDLEHYSEDCGKYRSYVDRKTKLADKCYICFRPGHRAVRCKNKKKCPHCEKIHNRALCPQKTTKGEQTAEFYIDKNTTNMHNKFAPLHLLQTAVTQIKAGENETLACRLLLDSGSQRSYITSKLFKKLHITPDREDSLMIYTFGSNTPKEVISPSAEVTIITKRRVERKIRVNIVPYITDNIPIAQIPPTELDVIADDDSNGEIIDLLIGNDLYFSFLRNDIIKMDEKMYLVDSDLGWLISGSSLQCNEGNNTLSVVTYCHCHDTNCPYFTEPDLPLRSIDLKFLWALESIGITDSPKTTYEEQAVQHFNETVEYNGERYEVKWPWIQYPPELPTNYGLAYGRLKSLLRRSDKDILNDYHQILKEQLAAKVIEIVEPEHYHLTTHPVHYLPHHMIKQKGKRGRIVYDASAKIKDEKSLNECLYRGPSMIEDLTGLILKFRLGKVGITADVEKAFLQVGLQKQDRDVTRFLWVKNAEQEPNDENVVQYRFCRVPFGVISSPFLLAATIRHHMSKTKESLLTKIADRCYVDNLITSTKTVNTALELYDETTKIFNELGMNIRDWMSNEKDFMGKIPEQQKAKQVGTIKILGLLWNVDRDTLQLKVDGNTWEEEVKDRGITKKGVLRVLARLYDPCGFVSPLVLPGKLLFQNLCTRKLKWDEPLPDDLQEAWKTIVRDLKTVNHIELPRYVGNDINGEILDYELHGFTDASINSYAAVVYLRIVGLHEIKTTLLMSKSRVTPTEDKDDLKIPRLELLGCLIGSRLLKYIKSHLEIRISKVYLWTDSQVVLAWTRTNKLLPPFVLRRINEIKQTKDMLKLELCYVNTKENPADIATRPELWHSKKELWINGPNYLSRDKRQWPKNQQIDEVDICLAGRALETIDGPEMTLKGYENEETASFTLDNQETPMEVCLPDNNVAAEGNTVLSEIKDLQKTYFPDEISGKATSLSKNLGLFLDEEGVLRCKGRLTQTNWSYEKKYPILIPKKSPFTDQTIKKTHEENYHVGVSHTLSILRNKYWIPQGRAQVQKVIRRCPQCLKHAGGPYKLPAPPTLPSERVNYSPPFTFTGLDYLGPVLVETSKGREKRWICILTCLAVRAIHLELVNDLTARECLLALRRFTALRGVPNTIISDNALYFKLVSEVLTSSYCIDNGIKWKFIAQLAPWQGGFYERLVSLIKHCLKRTLDKHLLTDSQMQTVVKEVESVLNTRPLTMVGSELEEVLRPADFLSLGQCLEIDPDFQEFTLQGTCTKIDLIKGWKRGRIILEEYKKMFVNQYLPSLREKSFHTHKQPRVKSDRTPKIGDIVQIKDDSKNRTNWKVGKITSLVRSRDGEHRTANIRVGNTDFTRSIGHLYPLEVEMADDRISQEESPQPDFRVVSDQPDLTFLENFNPATETTIPEERPEEIAVVPDQEPIMQTLPDDITSVQPEGSPTVQPEQGSSPQAEVVEEEIELPSASVEDIADIPAESNRRRMAAIRAREKIAEWTRLLLTLL
ncbi:uncharacterized protein [Choristoneura fumiferana]|uniref:uncharacterized protein n=1 Tax=Choristoneura fumiferana TaxID=7141 RepID=UPI003D157830